MTPAKAPTKATTLEERCDEALANWHDEAERKHPREEVMDHHRKMFWFLNEKRIAA